MKNKTEIWVSFSYGGWNLVFSKHFDLPFVPFHGLCLMDKTENFENPIRLETNEYCSTFIQYNLKNQSFYINVRNVWKYGVMDEVIDDAINIFTKTGWTREDNAQMK